MSTPTLPPLLPRSKPSSIPSNPIAATDLDASHARYSAVRLGYLPDLFIDKLLSGPPPPARPPLINVGTYLRGAALDALVHAFLDAARVPAQIVSLGAGSDTRFWRLATGPRQARIAKYVEVDLPENTARKVAAVRRHPALSRPLSMPDGQPIQGDATSLHAARYALLPCDLLHAPSALDALAPHLARDAPTLVLAECVLAYLPPAASHAALGWFAAHVARAPLACAVYEMFALEDAFGRVMRRNLDARGVALPGAAPFPTLRALAGRFAAHGFGRADAVTLKDVRLRYTEEREVARISRLEMLDEVEELDLLLAHYAITWGIKVPDDWEDKAEWESWGLHPVGSKEEDD